MSRFTDKLCPVCRARFTDNDDVVVCPECGTPHHRACYKEIGTCAVERFHADGFVWNGLLPDEEAAASAEQAAAAEQPQQFENADPHHAEIPNYSASDEQNSIPEVEEMKDFNPYFEMYKKIRELTNDEKRGEDGVSSKELCHFAGRSVVHYSQAFSAFRVGLPKNGRIQPVKVFLNCCAGMFAPIHQFYRRMDVLGIALLLLSALTSMPEVLLMYDAEYAEIVFTQGTVDLLNKLTVLCSFISFAELILLCIFGDYIYYKFCVRRIKKIRAAYDDGNAAGYYAALTESGAPSKLRIVIGLLAASIVSVLVWELPAHFLLP